MDTISAVALSRLVAQQRATDVAATNMANAATPGYRAERVVFSDWLSKTPGAGPGQTVAYTQDRATYRDPQPGPLQHSGNPLDLAITGDGYFSVRTENGVRLTRAGHFMLNNTGNIVDPSGNTLLNAAGQPLQLAPTDSALTVSGNGALSSANGTIGRIGVVRPTNPQALQAEGVDAFHFYTLNRAELAYAICRMLGLDSRAQEEAA